MPRFERFSGSAAQPLSHGEWAQQRGVFATPKIPAVQRPPVQEQHVQPEQLEERQGDYAHEMPDYEWEKRRERMRDSFRLHNSRIFKRIAMGAYFVAMGSIMGTTGLFALDIPGLIQTKQALTKAGPGFPDNDEMERSLNEEAGGYLYRLNRQRKRKEAAKNKKQEKLDPGPVSLTGFEKLDLDPAAVREYIGVTFPSSWSVGTNLKSISIDPHFVEMHYPGFEGKAEFAHCSVPGDGAPAKVEFVAESLKNPTPDDVLYLMQTIIHELAHANDWTASQDLSTQGALELQYSLLKGVTDPRRPKYGYPEGIVKKPHGGPSSEEVTYDRMTEFFAEEVTESLTFLNESTAPLIKTWESWESAFTNHLVQKRSASEEAAAHNARTMRRFFSQSDPQFKPWVAAEARLKTLNKVMNGMYTKQLQRQVQEMGDPVLTQEVTRVLELPEEAAYTRRPTVDEIEIRFEKMFYRTFHDPKKPVRLIGVTEDDLMRQSVAVIHRATRLRLGAHEIIRYPDLQAFRVASATKFRTNMQALPSERRAALQTVIRDYSHKTDAIAASGPMTSKGTLNALPKKPVKK